MKYPSEWTFVPEEQDFTSGIFDYSAVIPPGMASLGGFCPTSYVGSSPKVLDCQDKSPVSLEIIVYKLKDGTTLKEFYDGKIAQAEELKALAGSSKIIETSKISLSGLSAIQTISERSLQLIHLYWLTSDVVLQKIFGESFFLVPKTFLPLFVVIDYIEIPALFSGIIFYTYNIHSDKQGSKKSYLFLGMLVVQVFHIFWLTDNVVYNSFFRSSFVEIPLVLAWIAILIDYLELPVIGDLLYKIIRKKRLGGKWEAMTK